MEISNADYYLYDRRKGNSPVNSDRRTHVDDSTRQKNIFNYAFDTIPMFRRVESIPDKAEKGETATALGMASLALINFPEDLRDVKGSVNQVKSYLNGVKPDLKYDYSKFQHPFSFFRGTLLKDFANPNKAKNPELAQKIFDSDKTLAQTKFGKKLLSLLNIENVGLAETKIESLNSTKENPKCLEANIYEGTKFGKLTARMLERTTKWGVGAMAILELPQIAKAFCNGNDATDKANNGANQIVKSGINVAAITAGIGYMGAIGSKYAGPVGSLVGMGLGAVIGGYGSKKMQSLIS